MAPYYIGDTRYDDYTEYRNANVARNNARLRALGLDNGMKASIITFPKKKIIKSIKVKQTPPPRRTSSRLMGKQPDYSDKTIRFELIHKSMKSSKLQRTNKQGGTIIRREMTPEQRATLVDCNDWLTQLNHFLREVPHGSNGKTCSSDNARQVMRQVEKLVSGSGISYHRWPDGIVFKQNEPISLNHDFHMLYNEAQAFENLHGRDLGNGWLLRHPVHKLSLFQDYMYQERNSV